MVHFLFTSRTDARDSEEKKESLGSEKDRSLEVARKVVKQGVVWSQRE